MAEEEIIYGDDQELEIDPNDPPYPSTHVPPPKPLHQAYRGDRVIVCRIPETSENEPVYDIQVVKASNAEMIKVPAGEFDRLGYQKTKSYRDIASYCLHDPTDAVLAAIKRQNEQRRNEAEAKKKAETTVSTERVAAIAAIKQRLWLIRQALKRIPTSLFPFLLSDDLLLRVYDENQLLKNLVQEAEEKTTQEEEFDDEDPPLEMVDEIIHQNEELSRSFPKPSDFDPSDMDNFPLDEE